MAAVPITDDDIQTAIAAALKSPSSVEIDGKKVTNRSAEDLSGLIGLADGTTAKARNVLHISRCSPGGSPVD